MNAGSSLPIGYYQFRNLITNRVPFLILSLAVDFSEIYSGMELSHATNYSAVLDIHGNLEAQAMAAIAERNWPKTNPVVVVCPDGKLSKTLADFLDKEGFLNSYYLIDGFENFKKDINQ